MSKIDNYEKLTVKEQIDKLTSSQFVDEEYISKEKIENIAISDKKRILFADSDKTVHELGYEEENVRPDSSDSTVHSLLYFIECEDYSDFDTTVYAEDVKSKLRDDVDVNNLTQIKTIVSIPWKKTFGHTVTVIGHLGVNSQRSYHFTIWDTNVKENGEKTPDMERSNNFKKVTRLLESWCEMSDYTYTQYDDIKVNMSEDCTRCNSTPGCNCRAVPVLLTM